MQADPLKLKEVKVLTPGVVVIRNAVSSEDQEKIIKLIKEGGGLKDENGKWNFFGKRGRRFDAIENYPDENKQLIKKLFAEFRDDVQDANAEIPYNEVSHMLTNWYPNTKGMAWHVDGYGGNDGDPDIPVYSLTIGNSCIFEFNYVGEVERHRVQLDSGDLIVFGGPQRLMKHRVARMLPNFRDGKFRINLTFRYITNFSEEDLKKYQTDNYTKRLKEQWNKKRNNNN